jgi:hypothetical protein
MSQVTSREAEATGRELMRLLYSRSSIERVGHAVGAEYLSRRENVEPKLIETCELPPGIASVSVSVDRVTVPMEEPVPKEPEGTGRPVQLREETLRKYGQTSRRAPKPCCKRPCELRKGIAQRSSGTTAWRTAPR